MAALQSTVHSNSPNRDKDHYHETGDSIIRVENVLFKIHKFPLTHNSSVFATMFNLPVGIGNMEGLSDDIPIVLEGEKAEDLQAVLKYIYAPPVQTQMERITIAALPEIISLVKLSHKYGMDHWKEWGVQVVKRLLDDLDSVPTEHLQPLYSLYNLVGDAAARARVMKHWCEVIEANKLSIVPALDAASTCDDQDAMTDVYCIQIRRWEKANVFEPTSYSEEGVCEAHIQRIRSGYMSLSLSWSQFRSRESPYPHYCTEDTYKAHCIPSSRQKWAEAIADAEARYPHLTQLTSRLSHIAEYLQDNNRRPVPFSRCFFRVVKLFQSELRNVHTYSLTKFFFPARELVSIDPNDIPVYSQL
ncbi:BTB domain-containing protein [Mycena sanguinolenta]|uniref:BTB domain-containing protein n=1 Tax=Mycena sanguinolenta TaxID=230812 RepID=A0A8H6X991_9AGAR|nr:BTB domain-containing protein [Mycena sanguinolenta]